jgi:cellulose synthase/poly-beta-1,6-N-acetylglucosamine synthase-like glycosyltransferase
VEVSVIVPAWNAVPTLGRALEALAAQRFDDGAYEVVVVDNGSTDATRELIEAAPGVRLVARGEHGLAGEARNDGAAAARGSILAFTDADCFPEPDWLANGVRALEQADVVQGRVRPDPGAPIGPFDRSLWVGAQDGLFQTANMFMRRELFERVGGFEELHGDAGARAFGEDVWLGWRAVRAGARAAFAAEAVVNHAVLPRGASAYVRERARLGGFPMLVARIPELRGTRLTRGLFLSERTAAFDLALAGAATALARRSRWPLAAALPYAWTIGSRALESGPRRAPLVAAVELAADAVGLAALVRGSLRHRAPVL